MENGKEIILFETKDKSIALPVMVEMNLSGLTETR